MILLDKTYNGNEWLEIRGQINAEIIYKAGIQTHVTIEGIEALKPSLEVTDGIGLVIGRKGTTFNTGPLMATIVTSIPKIVIKGQSEANITGHINLKKLEVSGQSTAIISQSTINSIGVSGQSDVKGTVSNTTEIQVSGQSSAKLTGTFQSIEITGSGMSKITLKGTAAQVIGSVSGMSKAKLPIDCTTIKVSASGMSEVKY